MADIKEAYKRYLVAKNYINAFKCIKVMYDKGELDRKDLLELRNELQTNVKENPSLYSDILKQSYFLTAKDNFDDYCIALEWNRPLKSKFYLPRRKQLLPLAQALQELVDDKLDILTISMPPSTGKSTIAIFFITWLGGLCPNETILTGSHSASILDGMYKEVCKIIMSDDEYLWKAIFPTVEVARTNAKDMQLDLDKPKRFSTYQFGSIGSNLAGKLRATKLLYCDDLIGGIEEAMNIEQLEKKYRSYTDDYLQRQQGKCKELHIATRWSVHDIIGHIEQDNEGNNRYKSIVVSALDENDESNFDYPFNLGHDTAYYQHLRDILDPATWKALYMNQPIEREGLLYAQDELRRFFELPDREPDMIIAVCDTKDKGSDYCAMPIAFCYGQDFYIPYIFHRNENPDIIEPLMADKLVKYKVQMARFESNSAGGRVAEHIQQLVKEKNGICKITTKYTTQNKETKIIANSPFVKEHFIFLDDSVSDIEYKKAMNVMCSYTMAGKNKHDDLVDAMAQLVLYIQSFECNKIELIKRLF